MKNKKTIIIGGIVLLTISIFGYFYIKDDDSVNIVLETITVKKGNVTTMVTATGTIEPITQVAVGTQVSGVVEKIYVDYNSVVKEGQLIAELNKTNLSQAKIQAHAAYDNAISQKKYMLTIYDRQKTLYDNQVLSKADYNEALYNYQTAKGTATQRLSDLQKAKNNLSYANIYSPIDGVVLSKAIDEGQTVAASYSTPTLFTIAQDLKEMQVEADVDEADIGEVKEGQRVTFTVDAYQGRVFNGVVTQVRLDPTITSNVVTYIVVIKADNPDLKLKPGLTATISIYTLELKNVLSVEAKAINFKPIRPMMEAYYKQKNLTLNPPKAKHSKESNPVWIYKKDGTITPVKILLGASDGVNVQILKGVNEGDKLVYSLKNTSKTQIKHENGGESPFMPKRPGGKKKK